MCEGEDVFGGEGGESFEEEEERGEEEDCEGARNGGGDGADGYAVDFWGGARFAIVAYCFGEEDGSEEEGEGFDSGIWLVWSAMWRGDSSNTYVPQETPIFRTEFGVV